MDHRRLGHSGLRVPALSFGTTTFGGGNDFFKAWGATDAGGARHARPRIAGTGPTFDDERLFRIVDAMDAVAAETGKTITQIALNWLLQKPTVSSVIIGARNEEQLVQNIGAVGWQLTPQQIALLDAASDTTAAYPVWHQRGFPMLNEAAG